MGQGQSQQAEYPVSEWDPSISPEERAQAQADLRAKQQAALDKRIAAQKKFSATAGTLAQGTRNLEGSEQTKEKPMAQATPETVSGAGSEAEPGPEPERESREVTSGEQAQANQDLRTKQQAALDKRFAAKQKKGTTAAMPSTQAKKKPNVLEQASQENVGYRNMDAQREFRSWN